MAPEGEVCGKSCGEITPSHLLLLLEQIEVRKGVSFIREADIVAGTRESKGSEAC